MAASNGHRPAPSDEHAEAALLGAALLIPEAAQAIADRLSPEDFYSPRHKLFAQAILELVHTNSKVDVVLVESQLGPARFEQAGGKAALADLFAGAGLSTSVDSYIRRIVDARLRRQIIGVAYETIDEAYDGDPGPKLAELAGIETNGTATAEVVALVRDRLGIVDTNAANLLAGKVSAQHTVEQVRTLARQIVHEEQVARDTNLAAIVAGTGPEMLALPKEPRRTLLGALVLEGHNATVTARYKVGKSTLVENATVACVAGGLFLARFPVAEPRRVAYLNYELDTDDMVDRIRRMNLDDDALERLLVVNLRGYRLPLTMPAGRDWLVERLLEHRSDVLVVDPFGAAFASAGGENENDNAEVRRFLIALDELKRAAGCPSLLMPMHTGRGEQVEGDEHGRGATVVDDWADVRMILTRDVPGFRYLRTDGRALDLDESRLGFDPETNRLMLAGSDIGVNRYRARHQAFLDAVCSALREFPGCNTRQLRGHLGRLGVKNTGDQDEAKNRALAERAIHLHERGPAILHYLGPAHTGDEDCPEGWKA